MQESENINLRESTWIQKMGWTEKLEEFILQYKKYTSQQEKFRRRLWVSM